MPNATLPPPEVPTPKTPAEKKLLQQFLTQARLIRSGTHDPETAEAAVRWEKFLTQLTPA